jgi:hypothetical protein
MWLFFLDMALAVLVFFLGRDMFGRDVLGACLALALALLAYGLPKAFQWFRSWKGKGFPSRSQLWFEKLLVPAIVLVAWMYLLVRMTLRT